MKKKNKAMIISTNSNIIILFNSNLFSFFVSLAFVLLKIQRKKVSFDKTTKGKGEKKKRRTKKIEDDTLHPQISAKLELSMKQKKKREGESKKMCKYTY